MKKLSENEIINIFQTKLGNKKFVSEDVERFTLGKTKVIAKTDTMVQSTDIPDKMRLSDVISVNLPKSISRKEVNDIARGFKKACEEYEISIIGGDTNEGKEIVFNICILGNSNQIITRNGANEKDVIFTTGPFGYTFVGLDILLNNKKKISTLIKKSIKTVTNPKPRLNYGLKNKKYFTSAMDSSDGLSTTLNEMSKQSKKKFIINKIPINTDLDNYLKKQNNDLNKVVFHGGEEYEFVFTIPSKYKKNIIKNAKLLKTPIIEIGYVTSGKGVYVKKNEGTTILKDLGWKHFK
jgi:thiamine-monophosphate kinase